MSFDPCGTRHLDGEGDKGMNYRNRVKDLIALFFLFPFILSAVIIQFLLRKRL